MDTMIDAANRSESIGKRKSSKNISRMKVRVANPIIITRVNFCCRNRVKLERGTEIEILASGLNL